MIILYYRIISARTASWLGLPASQHWVWRAPWGSGASARQPWRTWWSRRSSSWRINGRSSQTRPINHLSFHESMEATKKQHEFTNDFTNDLWWFHDLNCDPGRNRCLTRKGPDHQQYQRLPSRSELRLLHFSCCTMLIMLIMLHLYDLCLSLNCGRSPSIRLWASWSPLWDLVVWTSW